MTRHIHADHMIAAANDMSIEWQRMSDINKDWANVGKSGDFTFYPESQYRQRPAPHPHQAMIDQAKADPSIEWQYEDVAGNWLDTVLKPTIDSPNEYRQKPKMVDLWQWSFRSRVTGGIFASNEYHADKPVDSLFQSSAPVCRIEGSKISVEVSQ